MRKFYLLFVLISGFSYGQIDETKKQIEIDADMLTEHEVWNHKKAIYFPKT